MTSKLDEIVAATLPLLTRSDPEVAAFLYLDGPDDQRLHLRGVSGFVRPEDLLEQLPVDEATIAGAAAPPPRAILSGDGHVLFRSPTAAAAIRHLACAPVRSGDVVRGLLVLARRTAHQLGATEDALLTTAAALVGASLEQARLAELLERAKEQLVDLGRLAAVGQLVPGVAHEVNNPLTTVLGHTQLLLTRPDLSEHLRQRLQLVATEGARAARLIQSFLAFARTRPADRRSCSLVDLARRVLELKAHQLNQDNVRVVTEFGDGPAVHADEREMQHALLALVQRAHEAMRERSDERVLTVRTGAGGGQVWVDVLDTGPALAPEVLDGLADPLTFAGAPGPGLALAHRIVSDHGGRLQGGPRPEGGTAFSIVLPAAAPAGGNGL